MPKNKKKSRRKLLVFSLIFLALAGTTVFAILRKREVPLEVQVEAVTRRNLTELVSANGRIQPVVQVVINPEISGEIVALPVKEGQHVERGDLLVKIKPDNYVASTNSAFAMLQSSLAAQELARANQAKSEWEFQRQQQMHTDRLVSDFEFQAAKTSLEVTRAQFQAATHQNQQARAALAKALDDLAKTTIVAPIAGTITKLKSQVGERVVGSTMMAGTEIMTVANLEDMEARVDISEIDVVLIQVGQKARLEVEAFRDRKFTGTVTEIANSSRTSSTPMGGGGQSQEATKFEVKIHIAEKEAFRPGMSVTADIETRYRTNVLTVPIQSVTTRMPKPPSDKKTNTVTAAQAGTNATGKTNGSKLPGPDDPARSNLWAESARNTNNASATNVPAQAAAPRKPGEAKAIEVVFMFENDRARMVPVKRGVSDDAFSEIVEGVSETNRVVSGSYKAINRDLEDNKKVKVTAAKPEPPKK